MDVLSPELLYLPNGAVYRINPSFDPSISIKPMEDTQFEGTLSKDDFETCRVDFNDMKQTIECPPLLLKYVIGKKGEKKREIEQETKTRITIPDRESPDDPIVVQGLSSAELLNSAITRIQMTMERGRSKEPFTHFVSLPIANDEILETFNSFKDSVFSTGFAKSRRIDESLFQKPQKLHLTVATLTLLHKREIKEAVEILNNLHGELSALAEGANLQCNLKGLEIMNDDPSSVVLYAKIEGECSTLLQVIVDTIYERFSQTGYLQTSFDRESVKMHVTLMNKRFRNERVTQSGISGLEETMTEGNNDDTFDVREVLEKFSHHDFGKFLVSQIHLSQRYSTNTKTGYYSDSCVLTINKTN